jgi:S1-C subfamily serine protease
VSDDAADDEDAPGFRPPPHPDDRLWRHPSEVGSGWSPRRALLPLGGAIRRPEGGRRWPLALTSAAVGGLVAVLAMAALGIGERVVQRQVTENVALDPALPGIGGRGSLTPLSERLAPAVVTVGEPGGEGSAPGSGIIVRDDGIVLTSAALVSDPASGRIAVGLPDGSTATAELMGLDPTTGIAVLDLPGESGYAPAVLAVPADLTPGTPTFTVGAGASGDVTVVSGALGPSTKLTFDDAPPLDGLVEVTAELPTDGDPATTLGAAAVDDRGAVVGIATATAAGSSGEPPAAYVTPIEVARKVAEDLVDTGEVDHGWLGIEGASVPPDEDGIGLYAVDDRGAIVALVVEGSPAAEAGMQAADVVVEADGRPIARMPDLVIALRLHSPGDQMELTVLRGGERRTATVTLEEPPTA